MQTESALDAQRGSSARNPSGLRRLSLAMLATERTGETFTGLPEKSTPGRVLAAFKAAAPALGYGPRVIHAIDWLFSFTQPQDWTAGQKPIVWPSAGLQQEALSLGVTQAKALNRYLVEIGLVTMRDSPNGKRYGKRDAHGRIVEAYGFDLSPLAARLAEFQAVAEHARAERECLRHLRRRATIARKGLDQVLETAAELGFTGPEWRQLGDEARALARVLRKVENPDEMAVGVASLERRHKEARERLESATFQVEESSSKGVDSDPLGSENRPHQYNYKSNLNSKKNTVIAHEECKSGVEIPSHLAPIVPAETAKARQEQQTAKPPRMDAGPVLRLTTDELVCLAPRLRPYLRTASPTWPEIVDAADWLRNDLGVSKSLWGDACLAMGREQAAIAVAIVSAKPPEHFTTTPGGYFNGMVARAKAGTLNLSRTIWGLRSNQQAGKEHTRRMN
jgi:replication initiation protein RepC